MIWRHCGGPLTIFRRHAGPRGLSRFNADRMNSFRDNQRVAERALDSDDLERERGTAIPSKATSLVCRDTRIDIVDAGVQADFGAKSSASSIWWTAGWCLNLPPTLEFSSLPPVLKSTLLSKSLGISRTVAVKDFHDDSGSAPPV